MEPLLRDLEELFLLIRPEKGNPPEVGGIPRVEAVNLVSQWRGGLDHHGDCRTRQPPDAGAVLARPHGCEAHGDESLSKGSEMGVMTQTMTQTFCL